MITHKPGGLTLKDEHRDFLLRHALSDEIIEGRGYYSLSVDSRTYLQERWHFSNDALRGEGIVIPRYSPDGAETYPQIRYTPPREDQKYTCPVNSGGVIDVHSTVVGRVQDVDEPLIFAESVKGADALLSAGILAAGFHGVWGWKHNGGPSAELRKIPMDGRTIGICFDVDTNDRKDLQRALKDFGGVLRFGGADVSVFVLPSIVGESAGIDDYLAVQEAMVGGHGPSVEEYQA
jgi:hypothetical protein